MTALANSPWLRPSMLPKLALCGQYRPEENAGEAAQRGTLLDIWFRDAINNGTALKVTTEDEAAVNWALETARLLAGGFTLEARESELKIEAAGMTGTADLLCEGGNWSADLKTGQMRNYREQQATYALGFMDRFFVDEWTVYLLFCDLQELVTLRFTREEAEQCIREVLAAVHDECQPRLNDYCGWCALRFQCSARREAATIALGTDALPDFARANGEQLRDFVLRAAVVEECADKARELLKDKCVAGEKIDGVGLVSKRGARRVPHSVVELHLRELGSGEVLAAYGAMPEAKLLEIWNRKLPDKPFPVDQVQEFPGSSYVRVGRPKK